MFVRLFLCSLVLTLTTTLSAQAAPVTMVRDYTYRASENDSKVSARKAALQQLQALVIEEVGVQVQSSLDSSERLDGEAFSRTVQTNIQSFAQALTRTRILEEQWDGEHFFLKAEIEVDPDGLGRQLQVLQKGTSADPCAAKAAEYQTLGKKLPGAQRTAELLALSLSVPFDYDCHRWQYDLAPALVRGKEPLPGYRDYLFAQSKSVRPEETELLLPMAIDAALRQSELSGPEWQQIIDGLARVRPNYLPRSLWALSNHTRTQKDTARPAPGHQQPIEQLAKQIEQLLSLADAGKIATPPMSRGELAHELYRITRQNQPLLAAELLAGEAPTISRPDLLLRDSADEFLRAKPLDPAGAHGQALDRLLTRLDSDWQSLERQPLQEIHQLLRSLDARAEETEEQARLVEQVVHQHRMLFANTLKTYPQVDALTRDKLFIRYQLPGSTACTPAECARQLFSDEGAFEASVLLLAHGTRASGQQAEVARKLERLTVQRTGNRRSETKANLISFLSRHGSADAQSVALMIRLLGDLDAGHFPQQARQALVAFYPGSLDPLLHAFPTQERLVQQRMLEVLGDMPADARIQAFLGGLAGETPHLRFAIEDALAAQLGKQ